MNARPIASSKPLLIALLTALLAPAAVQAQTPDGTTPAEEAVCDVLHDATPGLYGLCVAYCEAQDCDSVGQALSGQCQTPNPVLLDLFERKRRSGDPAMPCVSVSTPPPPCRCFGYEDLAALDVDVCQEFEEVRYDVVALSDGEEQDGAIAQRGDGWGACFLIVDGEEEVGYEISEEEAFACETLIRYTALEKGLACE